MHIFRGAPVTVTHKISEDQKILELRVHSPLRGRNLPEFLHILAYWLSEMHGAHAAEIKAFEELVSSGKLTHIDDFKRGRT